MTTELQKAFANSRMILKIMADVLSEYGLDLKPRDPLLKDIAGDMLTSLPEPAIKEMLYTILSCDPTPADRKEAKRLLTASTTAYTAKQLQDIKTRR